MHALDDKTIPLDLQIRAADAGLALVNALAEKRRAVRVARAAMWAGKLTQTDFMETCEEQRQLVARAEHEVRVAVQLMDEARANAEAPRITDADIPY